ncbi:MAG: hypothetical protein VX874_17625 [Pseudomonadota bacterium]|nr:hypothetical protein [Pseudomonadota bacterium]
MTWSRSLADPEAVFVADTSVFINLNASGYAAEILGGLKCNFVVPANVRLELENGRKNGHKDADALVMLQQRRLIEEAALGEAGEPIYGSLIDGSTARTLDDGEAATIGCAVDLSGLALIDERKALSLCAELFPDLPVVSTTELLLADDVLNLLGENGRAEAIANALLRARMRVPKPLASRVRALIGDERAAACRSLPKP